MKREMPDITGITLDLSHIYNYVVYQSCKMSFFTREKNFGSIKYR